MFKGPWKLVLKTASMSFWLHDTLVKAKSQTSGVHENIRNLLERSTQNVASVIDNHVDAPWVKTPCFLDLGRDGLFRGCYIQVQYACSSTFEVCELGLSVTTRGNNVVAKSPELADELGAKATGAASDEPGLRCHAVE